MIANKNRSTKEVFRSIHKTNIRIEQPQRIRQGVMQYEVQYSHLVKTKVTLFFEA